MQMYGDRTIDPVYYLGRCRKFLSHNHQIQGIPWLLIYKHIVEKIQYYLEIFQIISMFEYGKGSLN